jgi:hypothetical protein
MNHDALGKVTTPRVGAKLHFGPMSLNFRGLGWTISGNSFEHIFSILRMRVSRMLNSNPWLFNPWILGQGSGTHGILDIKDDIGPGSGYLMADGYFYSGQAIGNILFSMNLDEIRPFFSPKSTYWGFLMKQVGKYHIFEQVGTNPTTAPYFGKSIFSGRNIALGYWGRQYDEWIRLMKENVNSEVEFKQ